MFFPINGYTFPGYLDNQDLSTQEIVMVCYGGFGFWVGRLCILLNSFFAFALPQQITWYYPLE